MGMHMMPMAAEMSAPVLAQRIELSATARHGLFRWGGTRPSERVVVGARPRAPEMLDFDSATVHPGIASGTFVLAVTGKKPYSNMDVHLSPLLYIRKPEYWKIEVIGIRTGIGLPVILPYSVALPLDGIIGTKGIEVVGATKSKRINVSTVGVAPTVAMAAPADAVLSPAEGAAPIPTWDGDPGQANGVKHLFRQRDVDHMKGDDILAATGTIYLLDDYDDVKNNADKIYGVVKNKFMPPDPAGQWTDDMLSRFKTWMDNGFPKQ